jgi:hypothetical protein
VKGTLIKELYDLDIVCYLPNDSMAAGETLEDIYNNISTCLSGSYHVEQKTSALRLRSKKTADYNRDYHIDVVPGRFTDDKNADTFIYQKSADKCRLKTNLDVHVAHIRDSGVRDAIRLLKLWKTRRAIWIKQFVFELLIVDLLDGKSSKPLSEQLIHVLTAIKNSPRPIKVEDPANPTGNDLTGALTDSWDALSGAAQTTLALVASAGWEGVFGKIEKASNISTTDRAYRAAVSVSTPNQPWCENA